MAAEDVAEVMLSSLVVRRPRRFGDCWIGCKLWEDLGLRAFWEGVLGAQRGEVRWAEVVELLALNRLCDPRSELFVHQKWFTQRAMDLLLDTDAAVAEKDRLYQALLLHPMGWALPEQPPPKIYKDQVPDMWPT